MGMEVGENLFEGDERCSRGKKIGEGRKVMFGQVYGFFNGMLHRSF